MAKDRSLVRASDIGFWTFCHRAWWLANVKHVPHRNPAILQRGQDSHEAHGKTVVHAARLQRLGLLTVALGVALFAFMIIWILF